MRSSSQGPPHLFKKFFFREKKKDRGRLFEFLYSTGELFIQAEESLELNALLCFVPPTCYNKREEDWQTKMSSYSPFTFHLILEGAKVQTQDGSGMLS